MCKFLHHEEYLKRQGLRQPQSCVKTIFQMTPALTKHFLLIQLSTVFLLSSYTALSDNKTRADNFVRCLVPGQNVSGSDPARTVTVAFVALSSSNVRVTFKTKTCFNLLVSEESLTSIVFNPLLCRKYSF